MSFVSEGLVGGTEEVSRLGAASSYWLRLLREMQVGAYQL